MPSDRDVALVRAGLEAASKHMLHLAKDAATKGYAELDGPFHELAAEIRALDPAAIAATVEESDELAALHQERDHATSVALGATLGAKAAVEDMNALRARVAEAEALEIILEAATEGTDWVYAEVPQKIVAMRARVAELEQELAALRLDAERYKWLRDNAKIGHMDSKNGKRSAGDIQVIRWIGKTEADVLRKEALDEAIDAAMRNDPTA